MSPLAPGSLAADRARAPRVGHRAMVWLFRLVVAYLLLILVMKFLERRLIFFPEPYPRGNWRPSNLEFEDARFQSADGTPLHGWFVRHERPRAVMLIASGNGGNVTLWADDLRRLLRELRVTALAFDYRGYGRSEGTPDEQGVLADARAARAWLAAKTGVQESEIVLLGRSLGGGVMVDLAAKDGARGLVLQSTFTSIPDVAARFYPWLPVRLFMSTRFDSLAKIGDYSGPLLQSHGDADEIIPYELGRKLHDAARGDKEFHAIAGGLHNDPLDDDYFQALDAFLERLP